MAATAKALALVSVLVGWFGFLLPYLLSSTSDALVCLGFLATSGGVAFLVMCAGRVFVEQQIQKEKRR